MCLCNRKLDPNTRRMRAIGCASLAIALVLKTFIHPSNQPGRNCLDGTWGFLVGISLVFSLSALIRCRRGTQI